MALDSPETMKTKLQMLFPCCFCETHIAGLNHPKKLNLEARNKHVSKSGMLELKWK